MILEPPEAFVGWGIGKNGPFIFVCPMCPDVARAKLEAHGMPTVDKPCPKHFQEEQERRHP